MHTEEPANDQAPLAPLCQRLAAVSQWVQDQTEVASLDTIRQQMSELRQSQGDLNRFLEAPEVSDDTFDALTEQIGDRMRQLEAWTAANPREDE